MSVVKFQLYRDGIIRVKQFCAANKLPVPFIRLVPKHSWHVNACAFYRPDTEGFRAHEINGINICVEECGGPALPPASRNWSFPGNTTDREPYGVMCHELGHHVDWLLANNLESRGKYWSDFGKLMMEESGEEPISGYCPNPAEWFAEMCRMFIANHALLKILRPKTHALMAKRLKPVSKDDWRAELRSHRVKCPERVILAAENKVKKALDKGIAAVLY